VKLRGGRRGVLLIALGLTDHGVRAVLDVVLTGEEDVVSYWDLLVRLWRRYNLTLVVADGVKALDTAISSPDQGREADLPGPPQTEGGQEGEGLAGPPPLPRRVRPHPWLSPPLLPPRPQGGPLLRSNNLAESFNSLLESSGSATPPGGSPGP